PGHRASRESCEDRDSVFGRLHAVKAALLTLAGGPASARLHAADFSGLEVLRELAGRRFFRGIVLYTGREPVSFGRGLFALPMSALWMSAPAS
ncbi:MAG: hypothetical protein HYY35_09030, partial [Deltaproteobacteria bacterium]|nr:hypothetical protein [Deltaproteobacteria bacterium]